jgi:hypothetical protein
VKAVAMTERIQIPDDQGGVAFADVRTEATLREVSAITTTGPDTVRFVVRASTRWLGVVAGWGWDVTEVAEEHRPSRRHKWRRVRTVVASEKCRIACPEWARRAIEATGVVLP